MKSPCPRVLVVAALLTALAAPLSGQFCVTTTFSHNNGQAGNMFDITALNPVLIDDFTCNLDSGTHNIEIYVVTAGTSWQPVAQNASAWTLIGTTTVTSAGAGNPTPLGLSLGHLIPAGTSQGFYLTATTGSDFNYTNSSTPVGSVAASDSNLEILVGAGKAANFGTTYMPRIWNGTLCYTPGSGIFASFDSANTSGNAPLTVNFTDTSFSSAAGGISTWAWTFGDGGMSTAQNPSHTYTTPGTYDVSLTVTDPVNGSDTETMFGLVTVDTQLLVGTTSGGGVGDLILTGPPDPVGTTEGYLLISLNTTLPVGSGGFFGIQPDATTFQLVNTPASVGGLFHYLPSPATFPNVDLVLPPGIVPYPAGTSVDAVLIQVVGGVLVDSNVARVTF